jgi:hypothetical protein
VAAVAFAACAAGCGRDRRGGDPEAAAAAGSAGHASLAGAHRDPIVRAVLERGCARALQTLADRLADSHRFDDAGVTEPVACADLYAGPCRDAWRAMARHQADVAQTIEACAAVYCPSLAAPAPAACAPTNAPRDAAALIELDHRILAHDGSAPATAIGLSARGRLFVPNTVRIDDSAPPQPRFMGATLRIDVLADGYSIDGDAVDEAALARRVALAAAADPEIKFVVTTGATMPYARVVEALDVIKQAGGKHIAIAATPP